MKTISTFMIFVPIYIFYILILFAKVMDDTDRKIERPISAPPPGLSSNDQVKINDILIIMIFFLKTIKSIFFSKYSFSAKLLITLMNVFMTTNIMFITTLKSL